MADSNISSLPAVTTPLNTDEFAIVDVSANVTKKVALGAIRAKPSYQWNNLPDAVDYQWQLLVVDDETSFSDNSVIVYSDGSVWRYAATGSPVAMETIPAGTLSITTSAPTIANTSPVLYLLNPNFDSDTIWTKGTGWTIAAGVATHASGVSSDISQTPVVDLVPGEPYIVQYTVSNRTSGSVRAKFTGGAGVYGAYRTADGTYTDVLIPTASSTGFGFAGSVTFAGDIDNVVFIKPFGGVVPVANLSLSTTAPTVT